jgi:hypothetical protein
VLTGARVLLRPVTAGDAEALLEISMYDGHKAERGRTNARQNSSGLPPGGKHPLGY